MLSGITCPIGTDKKLEEDFEIWKKQVKSQIFKWKHQKLTVEEIYVWLKNNK